MPLSRAQLCNRPLAMASHHSALIFNGLTRSSPPAHHTHTTHCFIPAPKHQTFSLNPKVTPVRETNHLILDLYLFLLFSKSRNLIPKSNAQLCNRPAPAASSSSLSISPKEHMGFPTKLFLFLLIALFSPQFIKNVPGNTLVTPFREVVRLRILPLLLL